MKPAVTNAAPARPPGLRESQLLQRSITQGYTTQAAPQRLRVRNHDQKSLLAPRQLRPVGCDPDCSQQCRTPPPAVLPPPCRIALGLVTSESLGGHSRVFCQQAHRSVT